MPLTRNQIKGSRTPVESSKSPDQQPLKGIEAFRKTNNHSQLLRPSTSQARHSASASASSLSSSKRIFEPPQATATATVAPPPARAPAPAPAPAPAHASSTPSISSLSSSQPPAKVFNILIGVTGSVATIKLLDLLNELHSKFPQTLPYYAKNQTTTPATATTHTVSICIKIIATEHARHFIDPVELKRNGDKFDMLHDDHDEWSQWKKIGDPVLHIELRKWADLFLIAPLDANTMAKMANGICDNLLTCTVRAWDISKPLIYCPAMNVHMYNHPITREQLSKLQSFGYQRVDSVEKRLACGDVGMGGMAPVATISEKVVECLVRKQSCSSPTKPIILNLQPTYPIIAQPSSCSSTSSPPLPPSSYNSTNNLDNHHHHHHNGNGGGGSSGGGYHNNNSIHNTKTRTSALTNSVAIWKQNSISTRPSNSSLFITKKIHNNNGASLLSSRNNSIIRRQSNIVTSIQNLHAIAEAKQRSESLQRAHSYHHHNQYYNNNNNNHNVDVDLNYANGLRTHDSEHDEEMNYNDFDPSRLLEQTLITTDEAMDNDQDSLSPQSNGVGGGSGGVGGGVDGDGNGDDGRDYNNSFEDNLLLAKSDYATPYFNTSRFLSMCQNKEKNCFTCAICMNDYKNRKSMARHLREQHVQGNIHRCSPCGTAYKRKEKLVKHIRERHGGRL